MFWAWFTATWNMFLPSRIQRSWLLQPDFVVEPDTAMRSIWRPLLLSLRLLLAGLQWFRKSESSRIRLASNSLERTFCTLVDLHQNECIGGDGSPPHKTMSSALWFKALVLFWFPIVIHSTVGNPFSSLNYSYYRTRPLFMVTPCATLWMIGFATTHVLPLVTCHDRVRLKRIETPIMHVFLSSIVWPIAALVAENQPVWPPTYEAFVWHGHHISLVSIPLMFLLTSDQFSSLWITSSPMSRPTLKVAAGSYLYWLFYGFAWNMIYFFGIVTPIAIWTGMNLAWTMNPMPPFTGRYYRLELAAAWFVYSASLRLFVCIVEIAASTIPFHKFCSFDELKKMMSLSSIRCRTIVGIAGIAVWIICGTDKASGGEYWIPVPLFGYTRFEIAFALLAVQATMALGIYIVTPKQSRARYLVFAFILVPNLLPLLGTEQYNHFTRPLTTQLFRHYSSDIDPSSQTVLSIHGVLAKDETRRLIQFTLKHKELWTKVSQSHALGYFMLGWRNDYFSSTKTGGKTYSLSHGWPSRPMPRNWFLWQLHEGKSCHIDGHNGTRVEEDVSESL